MRYIGDQEVIRRYIGDTLVWEKEAPPTGDYMAGFSALDLENTPNSIVETEAEGVWTTESANGSRFTNFAWTVPEGGEIAVKMTEAPSRFALGVKRTTSNANDDGLATATIYGVEAGDSGLRMRVGTVQTDYLNPQPDYLGKWLIVKRTTLIRLDVYLSNGVTREHIGVVDNSGYGDADEIVVFGWVQVSREISYPQVRNEPFTPSLKTITLDVEFDGTPTSVEFADLKYDKEGVLSLDWDDGALSSLAAATLFETTVYDDGTGKDIPWRAGVSVIGRSSGNNGEIGADPSYNQVIYSQMQTLISKGWDIQNHGLYSTLSGNYHSDSPHGDIVGLHELILDRIGYKMSALVVPAANDGYVVAANNFGYSIMTSQSDSIGGGLVAIPQYGYNPIPDIASINENPKWFLRSFTDTWNMTESGLVTRRSDLLASTSSVHRIWRIGTHNSSPGGFSTFVSGFNTDANNRIWVPSMRELMEYVKIRRQGKITVDGNTITVELPDGCRWDDFTLLVSGATVTSASSDDADDVTFNDGMINFYRDNS